MKYKGLVIPNIHLDKLKLKIIADATGSLDCVINYTSDDEVSCINILSNDCPICIFYKDNINKSIDYLIEKGYVTKEEALQFVLE